MIKTKHQQPIPCIDSLFNSDQQTVAKHFGSSMVTNHCPTDTEHNNFHDAMGLPIDLVKHQKLALTEEKTKPRAIINGHWLQLCSNKSSTCLGGSHLERLEWKPDFCIFAAVICCQNDFPKLSFVPGTAKTMQIIFCEWAHANCKSTNWQQQKWTKKLQDQLCSFFHQKQHKKHCNGNNKAEGMVF